jgi:hypothetical protein
MSQLKYILLIIIFLSTSYYAQSKDNNTSSPGTEPREELEKKNSATYLEKSHYREISFVFKDRLLQDIRSLGIIVGNFGKDVEGSTQSLEKIRNDYQSSVRYHYRRAYVISGKGMLDIYKDVDALYQKFALIYEKQADDLLIETVDQLTALEQIELEQNKSQNRDSRLKDIEDAKFKLKIAYFQMARGDEMIRDRRFADSLVHFRLAKGYAIKTQSDLTLDDTKKKELLDKNNVHLADNRNQNSNLEKAK